MFKSEVDRIVQGQSIGRAGLYRIGRNGKFSHILGKDICWHSSQEMRKVQAEPNAKRQSPCKFCLSQEMLIYETQPETDRQLIPRPR